MFEQLLNGFAVALMPMNIGIALVGCLVGTLIGVLPGLGPTATLDSSQPVPELTARQVSRHRARSSGCFRCRWTSGRHEQGRCLLLRTPEVLCI